MTAYPTVIFLGLPNPVVKRSSDIILNDSDVAGTTLTDALNSLNALSTLVPNVVTDVNFLDKVFKVDDTNASVGAIWHTGGDLHLRLDITSNKASQMDILLIYNGATVGTNTVSISAGSQQVLTTFTSIGIGAFGFVIKNVGIATADLSRFSNLANWSSTFGTISSVSGGASITITLAPGQNVPYLRYTDPSPSNGFKATMTFNTNQANVHNVFNVASGASGSGGYQINPIAYPDVRTTSNGPVAPIFEISNAQGSTAIGKISSLSFASVFEPVITCTAISIHVV